MLPYLLTALCSAVPAADPLQFPARNEATSTVVEVGIHVTPTRFRARAFTDDEHLLVFRDGAASRVEVRPLNWGGEVEYTYPRQALDGIEVEVLTLREGRVLTTRLIALEEVGRGGTLTLWIQAGESRSVVWRQEGVEISTLSPGASVLPRGEEAGDLEETPALAPTHVPVITPGDRPRGDLPPELERRPLPPV